MLNACTVPGPVLPMATSATGVTVVMTGGVMLLVRLGSPVGVLTLATFVRLPEAGAVMVRVTFVVWPVVRVPTFQLTIPLLFKPPPVALTKVTVAGRLSVTTTLLALEGPKLVTDMV